MGVQRKSFERGHRRKFLVVIDDSPECDRAVIYAAKRAQRTGGALVMLYIITPGDFQHWLGVGDIMRAEKTEVAEERLASASAWAQAVANIEPECVIREGNRSDQILALIEEDADIAILVLAAGNGNEGPGPLVSALASKLAGTFPIPVTIVPSTLDNAAIAALA